MVHQFTVRVAFLNVGQGDTIIISVQETQEAVIVDCVDADAVLSYLEQYGIQHIRGLIITHLHRDHYKGVIELLDNTESELNLICERVLFYQPEVTNKHWEKIRYDGDRHSDDGLEEKFDRRQRTDTILTTGSRYEHPNSHVFNALAQRPHIRLLCTQVTRQCANAISRKRPAIIKQFRENAAQTDEFFAGQSGCPCAGTVIIELGESARILQPSLQFHREQIIKRYFSEHQCSISEGAAISV